MNRRLAFGASLAVVLWAAVAVPMPFYEIRPGNAHAVEDLIELSAAVDEVEGDLSLLTVVQSTPSVLDVVVALVDPQRELRPGAERLPPEIDLDEYLRFQADAFDSAFTTAVALAAREAGYDVPVRTRAVVAQVLPDGPSDGPLRPGDELAAIDGTAVQSGDELVAILGQRDDPRDVELEVVRDGARRDVTIGLDVLPGMSRVGLGIVVETIADATELPFDAGLVESNIIGPSAGMMIALAATDLLLDEDLARGRTITGTGTIASDGRIGAIGGIEQKVEAAVDADADLLLVPIDQLEVAAAAADGRVEVIGVATLADALDALRGTSDDLAAPQG